MGLVLLCPAFSAAQCAKGGGGASGGARGGPGGGFHPGMHSGMRMNTGGSGRIPGGNQQVTVQKISPAGTLLWGKSSTITSDASFEGNPHRCQLSTGDYGVA